MTVWTPERVGERIRELGPWFHNMDLQGVATAPEHFLGDFPRVKWNSFASDIPTDLSGKTVLDIGCNAGFYSMEMKRRGAARVLGIDFDEDYLAQARFAADVEGLDIEFRQLSVYDVGSLGEQFDIVFFIGVLYHLRHPLLALDLIHEHVARDMLVFQSMQRGTEGVMPLADDYEFWENGIFDDPRYPKMQLHRKQLRARQHQLVGAEPKPVRPQCCEAPVFPSRRIPRARCSSAAAPRGPMIDMARCILPKRR